MKPFTSFAIAVVILSGLFACGSRSHGPAIETITVDMSKEKVLVSKDQLTDYRFVPLETDEKCLISQSSKLLLTDSAIVIYDKRQRKAFVFNAQTGAFLNTIGNKGEGPEEYMDMDDIYYDSIQKRLMVLDLSRSAMEIYDINGHFKTRISLTGAFDKTGYRVGLFDKHWVFDRNSANLDGRNISFVDTLGFKPVKTAISIPLAIRKGGFDLIRSFDIIGDTLYYMPLLKDTIYTFDKQLNQRSRYYLDIVKNKFPDEKKETQIAYGATGVVAEKLVRSRWIWQMDNLLITDDWVYFSINYGIGKHDLYYNKKSKKSYMIFGAFPDTTAGIFYSSPLTSYHGSFVSTFTNEKLVSDLYRSKLKKEVTAPNPIVVFFKLKL